MDKIEGNRDTNAPSNVESFIQNLLSAERVAELKPDDVVAALMIAENAVVADLGSGPGVFTHSSLQAGKQRHSVRRRH